ncbi:AMP-binding protein [Mesorhizobium sp. L-8-3]|uniref:AMP-binding protein n=1 Tax=Mesorhizobium sp. L-8-3 TaxID=2744522 RepID=UPI001926D08C|nr:AMP-binding protein [Mesorhizobium sp. L-8-3]BCH27228.1 cyclohexanecarboxylate-CoA ligase [Mesorhizobium sp. L-8-3]
MNPLDERLNSLRASGRTLPGEGRALGAVALEKAQADPDRVIVIEGERHFSRGEILDLSLRLGGALKARGLERGDAIAFQLPNWWEACVVNLAAALFGFRIIPLLTIYREAELGTILPVCGVKAAFVPREFRGMDYPALMEGVEEHPLHVFTVRGDGKSNDDFAALVRHEPADPEVPPADDIKLVLFTSGSTGRPKGVIHSHATIDVMTRHTGQFWSTGPGDVFLVASPIGHIGGSIYAFEFPWITGCVAMMADSWAPERAVELIDRQGVTFMAGATPFLAGLIAAAERAGSNLPGLRRFICGGASVPPELVRRGLERFPHATVSRAYGSTEVPLACPGIRTREEAMLRADTDGECASEIRILSETGEPVPEGESGEIVVKAPQMLIGYLDPADEDGAFTKDGFFRMGDLGRLVSGRFIQITGRKKDIIIRKGENISPLEIENALARHEAVKQASVVGVPEPERGEMVVAFVIPAPGASFTFADMTAHLTRLGLARQKFPERLHIVSELPLNSVGKVQKNELRIWALERA